MSSVDKLVFIIVSIISLIFIVSAFLIILVDKKWKNKK